MPKRPVIPVVERIYEPDKDREIKALQFILVDVHRRQKAAKKKEEETA